LTPDVRSLAVLSMHTSPLAQPGTGDGGGMNVYVRELSSALARAGVSCDVYTRAVAPDQPAVVHVEPGLRVHHVPAGPLAPVAKELLPALVDDYIEAVIDRLRDGYPPDAIHANYWLSGVAGHHIKHELDLPLVSTFHTLDRVKAEVDEAESELRAEAEARTIDCSDGLLASCTEEAKQLVRLYDADPARIEIVAPGVDHAFFAPGNRKQARRALGLPETGAMLLFVGRIQPLKRADVAVRALHELAGAHPDAFLVLVGGPSGPRGDDELAALHRLVDELGLADRVRFVPPQRHELLSTWYRAADVCLVPSRSESFGLVALEAAACGTPVVAAAVGGLTTLVDHGVTGYLVEDRDPMSYAESVTRILDDDELAAAMGARATARARGYTWSVAAGRLRRLYADLTARQLVQCP
jgi:D-inositol-3-phosphate glycosyltransferase